MELNSFIRFVSNSKTRKSSSRGFTLIELMVVVAIIAGTVALVVPRIASRNNQTKQTLREITTLSRQLHQKAKLTGTIYRLVIDMKDGDKKGAQGFWVEKGGTSTLIKTGEDIIEKDKDGREVRKSDFTPDRSVLKKPHLLPTGMYFDRVELSRLKDPLVKGRAYIHYMPQGLAEEAAIHLKNDKDQKWTISVHPLTGKAEILSESTSLKDFKSQ